MAKRTVEIVLFINFQTEQEIDLTATVMCRFIPIMPDLENMEIEEVRDVLLQQAKWARKFATTPGKRQAAEVWMEVIKDLEISMGSEDPLPMAAPTKGCYEEG